MRHPNKKKKRKHTTKSKWKMEKFGEEEFNFLDFKYCKKVSIRHYEDDKNMLERYGLWRVVKNTKIDNWYTYEGNWECSKSKKENNKLFYLRFYKGCI